MELENFIRENQNKLIEISWNDTINKYGKNLTLSKTLLESLKKRRIF